MVQTAVKPPAAAAGAGQDGLFVLLARFAKVHMQIDQARCEPQVPGIDHFSSGHIRQMAGRLHRLDAAVAINTSQSSSRLPGSITRAPLISIGIARSS
jgi:hypothetical protein